MRLLQKHRLLIVGGYRAATRGTSGGVSRIYGENGDQYYYTNILETRKSTA
jgi:hypothetical protein